MIAIRGTRTAMLFVMLAILVSTTASAQTGTMRVSLPSSAAASLGKFGDVPVSLATGAPA